MIFKYLASSFKYIWDNLKIAPRLKCYKNASRLNRYNFPTDNAIDFLVPFMNKVLIMHG